MLTSNAQIKVTQSLYDELMLSARLDHDPWSKPSLHTQRPRHLKMHEAIRAHLPGPRDSIADIGCHNGFFLRLSSDLGFTRFVAVDYFPLPCERSFLSELNGVQFIKANFNDEHFLQTIDDKSLDVVVSTEVFEHVYNYPLGYLRECWRIIRPGGLFLLTTPNPCTIANAARLALGKETGWGSLQFAETPRFSTQGEPAAVWDIHFREYTQEMMLHLVQELDGAEILEKGFLANRADPFGGLAKRFFSSAVWKAGLGTWRPLCAAQYLIVRQSS